MGCPVNNISKATFRGTARPTATPGVVQNKPTLTLQIQGKYHFKSAKEEM